MIEQVLREWPPGFGGVERVAHELASVWGGVTYSFDVQSQGAAGEDPLPVAYPRRRLPSANPFGVCFAQRPLSMAICLRRVFCWC